MPRSYKDKITVATTKKELIKIKEEIEKSTNPKVKIGELLKIIDDKMDNMNDNDISDDGRLSELADAAADAIAEVEHKISVPPPAKRIKFDDLEILIEKKSRAELELHKAKSDYEGYLKNRQEIMNKETDYIIDKEDEEDEAYKADMKGYLVTNLVLEIDRSNVSLKQAKQYAEIFIITCWIKESYERMNKYEKEYNDARKELKEYRQKN
jgi:hypothetical protein